jgi:hypothetical protein
MKLSKAEISILLTCALNTSMAIHAASRTQTNVVAVLIAKGYMQTEPENVWNVKDYPTLTPGMKRGTKAWLTEQGKAAIRALLPDDFRDNNRWPLSADVQRAAARVNGEGKGD